MPAERYSAVERRIISRLKAKKGKAVRLPEGFHDEIGQHQKVERGLRKLKEKGFVFVRQKEEGTHLKDGTPLTKNQKDFLSHCKFDPKTGEFVVPHGISRILGKEDSLVSNFKRRLKKKGYKFKIERELPELQKEILEARRIRTKKGRHILPWNVGGKVDSSSASVTRAIGTLKEKGYNIERDLPPLQKEILKNCVKDRKGNYIRPYALHKKLDTGTANITHAIRQLEKKGYTFRKGPSPLEQTLLDNAESRKGTHFVPKGIEERIGKKPHEVSRAIKTLREKGYRIEREVELTELQEKVLDECEFIKGRYILPENLHKQIGRGKRNIQETIPRLEKKGFKFKKEEDPKITRMQKKRDLLMIGRKNNNKKEEYARLEEHLKSLLKKRDTERKEELSKDLLKLKSSKEPVKKMIFRKYADELS